MQGKSDSLENFLDRFGQLTSKHGESLVKSCKDSGIARSLFYEIRDGKRTISDKVWLKLEAAERRMGIGLAALGIAESSANPKQPMVGEDPTCVREESPIYRAEVDPVAAAFAKIREGLDLLEQSMKDARR